MIRLSNSSSISSFQWSASEQVWPFETTISGGDTLYCKQVYCGALPNNGTAFKAHDISSFTGPKLHRLESIIYDPDGPVYGSSYAEGKDSAGPYVYLDGTYIRYRAASGWNIYDMIVRIIYKH